MRAFTEEQLEAIRRREGPLLLAAAAGSGKTSVLVERFVRMVVDDGIAPGRILAITFTEKAAGELRSRIRAELLARGERGLAQDAEAAWISTFHGFCARVLGAHAVAAGLDPRFAVLDEAAGRQLREAAFEAALAGLLGAPEDPPRADALDLVAAWTVDRLKAAVHDVHAQLRSAGQVRPRLPGVETAPSPPGGDALRAALGSARDAAAESLEGLDGPTIGRARLALERCLELLEGPQPPRLAAVEAATFAPGNTGALKAGPCARYLEALAAYAEAWTEAAGAAQAALLGELLERYGDAYAEAKRARSALDFDDLELLTGELFDRRPGLAEAWAARFDRIMVDEFQDTNPGQVALLGRLDSGHTFRVGDELQSIYGFRHASIDVFRSTFAELEQQGAVARLRRNFRTRGEILAVVNDASAPLHAGRYEPLVPGRDDAAAAEPLVELLLTHATGHTGPEALGRGDWDETDLGALPGGPRWRWAEARLLAQRIRELIESGAHAAGEIVVLVRAATDLATYERALEEQGLSTLAAGGRGFWARQQVQDLTNHLAALANPRDEPALLGVLASPLGPRLDSDRLALVAHAAREQGHGLWAAFEAGDFAPAWAAWFRAERERAARLPLPEILTRAVAASGYDEHVLRLPGGLRRLANVRKLIRMAGAYEREHGRNVRGFIDRAVAELEAEAREADAPVELAGLDAVRLMTIHAAKGLEFPVVAVADLGREPNTRVPDLLVDGDRVGVRLVTLSGSAKTKAFAELQRSRLDREREESLRVFHVALTRARERLILSGAANVEKWPKADADRCPPIGWLFPAFVPALHERIAARESDFTEGGVRVIVNAPSNGVLHPPPPAERSNAGPIGPQFERSAEEAVAPAAPPPVATLSYSALSQYAQCGYRFYLQRVLRLPEQDAPPTEAEALPTTLDPLLRGTLAHELLEGLDLASPSMPDPRTIEDLAQRHEAALTPADVEDLRALVAGALESPVMRRVAAARERHVEEAFALALGSEHGRVPLFTGFIDVRAVEADGTALIVDYKSDRLDGADPEPIVDAEYGVQRRLYALAALRAGAPRAEVAHLFLEQPGRPAVAAYERADVPQLEAEIAARAQDLLAGTFEVAPHPHFGLCATCPGRGGLCSWPEERVLVTLAES